MFNFAYLDLFDEDIQCTRTTKQMKKKYRFSFAFIINIKRFQWDSSLFRAHDSAAIPVVTHFFSSNNESDVIAAIDFIGKSDKNEYPSF